MPTSSSSAPESLATVPMRVAASAPASPARIASRAVSQATIRRRFTQVTTATARTTGSPGSRSGRRSSPPPRAAGRRARRGHRRRCPPCSTVLVRCSSAPLNRSAAARIARAGIGIATRPAPSAGGARAAPRRRPRRAAARSPRQRPPRSGRRRRRTRAPLRRRGRPRGHAALCTLYVLWHVNSSAPRPSRSGSARPGSPPARCRSRSSGALPRGWARPARAGSAASPRPRRPSRRARSPRRRSPTPGSPRTRRVRAARTGVPSIASRRSSATLGSSAAAARQTSGSKASERANRRAAKRPARSRSTAIASPNATSQTSTRCRSPARGDRRPPRGGRRAPVSRNRQRIAVEAGTGQAQREQHPDRHRDHGERRYRHPDGRPHFRQVHVLQDRPRVAPPRRRAACRRQARVPRGLRRFRPRPLVARLLNHRHARRHRPGPAHPEPKSGGPAHVPRRARPERPRQVGRDPPLLPLDDQTLPTQRRVRVRRSAYRSASTSSSTRWSSNAAGTACPRRSAAGS